MSGYSSLKECEDIIRQTVASDHNGLGLPLGAENYNMAAILRGCLIEGDRYYGYRSGVSSEVFFELVRQNVKGGK